MWLQVLLNLDVRKNGKRYQYREETAKCLHSMKCYGNSPVVPIFNNLNEYHLKQHTD